MKFRELDIPQCLRDEIEAKGFDEMYAHQEEAIVQALNGKNLVVAVPTASGKSIIGIVPALNMVITRGKKVLYIVPLKALATEKRDDFESFAHALGLKVFMSSGEPDKDDNIDDADIVVATSEKADSMLRHGNKWVQDVGMIIADEVHLIHDPGRGPTLEVTLTKFMCRIPDLQIIALSATISNAEDLAVWIKAYLVKSSWRPTELREGVYYEDEIEFNKGGKIAVPPILNKKGDPVKSAEPTWRMIKQTVEEGGQCIVFVKSRISTESLACKYAKDMKALTGAKISESDRILIGGGSESTSTGQKLAECIDGGIAFHHAGLDYKQRRCVEEGFRFRNIKCIIATPTLAAGINLPARRVIVRDTQRFESNVGNVPLPVMEIKQMCGRAGRPRYDPWGEAVLIAKSKKDRKHLFDYYVFADTEKLKSKLANEKVLRSHLLGLIATGDAYSEQDILEFMGKTFYGATCELYGADLIISQVVEFLEEQGLVKPLGSFRILKDLTTENNPEYPLIDKVLRMAANNDAAVYNGSIYHISDAYQNIYSPEKGPEKTVDLEDVIGFLLENNLIEENRRGFTATEDPESVCDSPLAICLFGKMLNMLELSKFIRKHGDRFELTDRRDMLSQVQDAYVSLSRTVTDFLEREGLAEKTSQEDAAESWNLSEKYYEDLDFEADLQFAESFLAMLAELGLVDYSPPSMTYLNKPRDEPVGLCPMTDLFVRWRCARYSYKTVKNTNDIYGPGFGAQICKRILDQLDEYRYIKKNEETFRITNRGNNPVDMNKLCSSLNYKVVSYLQDKGIAERITSTEKGEDHREFAITLFGKRISDLYVDPWSSVILRKAVNKMDDDTDDFMILQAISCTPDILGMYPKKNDAEELEDTDNRYDGKYLCSLEDECEGATGTDMEYENHMADLKTALLLLRWINEYSENAMTEALGIGPGDIRSRVDNADWLIYAMKEIASILDCDTALAKIKPLLTRIRYGVKEELIPLVSLKGVARARARTLYSEGYRTREDIRDADENVLANLPHIGRALARSLKEQTGSSRKYEPPAERETIDQDKEYWLEKMAAEEEAKNNPVPAEEPPVKKKGKSERAPASDKKQMSLDFF